MLADVVHTFGFTVKEIDQFDWAELVSWHCQHQRIQAEQAKVMQLTSQIASMTLLSQVMGGQDNG